MQRQERKRERKKERERERETAHAVSGWTTPPLLHASNSDDSGTHTHRRVLHSGHTEQSCSAQTKGAEYTVAFN